MKVLHLINTLSAGGAELHLLALCQHLKRQGIDIVVACLREHVRDSRSLRPDFEQEGIRVVNLHAEGRFNWLFLVSFMRLLHRERPDIFHTHLPRADLAGAIALLLHRGVWVCSVHGRYGKPWAGWQILPFFRWIWRRADAVIAISCSIKEWLVCNMNVPEGKITVIYYGIETERFVKPISDFRATWGLNDKMVIGSVGRLEQLKGHDYLIRAMPLILQQAPNAYLVIAGHDPWDYGRQLQSLIDELGLNKCVRLIGFQDDIPSFLHTIDVFAFASVTEGFGQVVIEAMAAGKPVVASRIAPMTEIVVDSETGLLVQPSDPSAFAQAIVRILTKPKHAQLMGEEGRMRVTQHFRIEPMCQSTMTSYQEVLNKKYR